MLFPVMRVAILFGYLLITLLVGVISRRRASGSSADFFLASRNISPILLFFTMAATNFSAFTVFGLSGAGYRIGYAFFPVMGFGTGFMALSFYLIGTKLQPYAASRGYITPSDFVVDRFGSRALSIVFSIVLIIFTLPYIAIQAVSAGNTLKELIGLPYEAGAALVTGFIVLYVALGGFRSIVWTDVVQGIMMVVFAVIAFVLIAGKGGGFVNLNRAIAEESPELFSRPGGQEAMLPGIWFGYFLLWFLADPMFPQLFQRFYAAKDRKTLTTSIVLYPLITTLLFFLMVSIGVMGRGIMPGLSPSESDSIYPMLLNTYAGVALSTVLLTGAIAALMSTMDSQLLTLTSIITKDFIKIDRRWIRIVTVFVLGLLGYLAALRPPDTILSFINRTTFNGLAVLAPVVLGGLYWRRATPAGAVASIAAGEVLVVLFYFEVISIPGILPVIPIVVFSTIVFYVISTLTTRKATVPESFFPQTKQRPPMAWILVFTGFLIAGNDFWNWRRVPRFAAGLPMWVWYYILLGVALSIAFYLFIRSRETRGIR